MIEIRNPNIEILNKFKFSKEGKFKTISPEGDFVIRLRHFDIAQCKQGFGETGKTVPYIG